MAETSAAARVLALPELLERILLNLNWRELFKILRTNKTFHDTVMGSIHLRRRMHLEYKVPIENPSTLEESTYGHQSSINDLNLLRDIEVGSYALYQNIGRPLTAEAPPLTMVADTVSLHRQIPSNDMSDRIQICKLYDDDVSHSWRAMKLTHLRDPVRFEIRARAGWAGRRYDEVIEFAEGEGTLGNIMDAIDDIRRRSDEQHRERRQELERREARFSTMAISMFEISSALVDLTRLGDNDYDCEANAWG